MSHHSDSDDNHCSGDTNKSSIITDTIDSQDDNQEPIGGLASFVNSAMLNDDLRSFCFFLTINSIKTIGFV